MGSRAAHYHMGHITADQGALLDSHTVNRNLLGWGLQCEPNQTCDLKELPGFRVFPLFF